MEIFYFLQYTFIQKALFAGSFVALACGTLGLFLVLKKMSLIGDGLSHVSFGAIALGLFLGVTPFYLAIPIVAISSVLILKISEKARVYGDASIGIVSAIGIASGIILTSLTQGSNVDLFSFLFGNILAISTSETILSALLSFTVLAVLYYFYWELFSTTFDEEYAKTTGIKIGKINLILTLLTSLIVVLSVKIVGIMLVSALLIFPAVTALQFGKNFLTTLFASGLIAVSSVILGIIFSFFIDLPSGATIVLLNALLFTLAILYKKLF